MTQKELIEIANDCERRIKEGFSMQKPSDNCYRAHEAALEWQYTKNMFEKYTPRFLEYVKGFINNETKEVTHEQEG